MIARTLTCTLQGIDAIIVEVEVDISPGLPAFSTVGLPDSIVRESKDRVRTALCNSGYSFPAERVTVNLAPAHLKKEGAGFDLPIAIAILSAMGIVRQSATNDIVFVGELALDGRIRPVAGTLPMAIQVQRAGLPYLVLPMENASEAAVTQHIAVLPTQHLSEVVSCLNGQTTFQEFHLDTNHLWSDIYTEGPDFAEVKGQELAKRALEVSAAAGHNILMLGPPGAGKTMLAQRLPTILPPLNFDEALETSQIYSVANLLQTTPLIVQRPFRAPHHSISDAGLVGGGQIPRPGEVSLAHNGVLFLDEFPEFRRNILDLLRQPLEDGQLTIARATLSITYPARFMLVAAMNPCPCGHFGSTDRPCNCGTQLVQRYRGRISGPILDRIDLHIEVPAVRYEDLRSTESAEPSAAIRERVMAARQRQLQRYSGDPIHSNALMRPRHIKKYCNLDDTCEKLLAAAVRQLGLSARAYHRILKVARTIADLDHRETIAPHHLLEAIQYRSLDRSVF